MELIHPSKIHINLGVDASVSQQTVQDAASQQTVQDTASQNKQSQSLTTQTTPPKSPVSDTPPVADVPEQEKADKYQHQQDVTEMMSPEDENVLLDEHQKRQQETADAAMDPQNFFKLYGYWDWNLAKDQPTGRLNEKSFQDTKQLSRLADALNNKLHWITGTSGYRTNSSFGTQEGERGKSERWEPIQTQEMRQMRADEQVDAATRARQMGLSASIQEYPLQIQKQMDNLQQQLTNTVSQTNLDLQRLMQASAWDAEYKGNWNAYWSNFMTKYTRELDADIKDRVLERMTMLKYPYSQMFAALWGGVAPNPIIANMWELIQSVSEDLSPKEKLQFHAGALSLMTNMLHGMTSSVFGDVVNLPFTRSGVDYSGM